MQTHLADFIRDTPDGREADRTGQRFRRNIDGKGIALLFDNGQADAATGNGVTLCHVSEIE